jgi:hypothetical protein
MSDALYSPYFHPEMEGLMRRILYSTMVICLLMALTGLPAYGYGGGGGGGSGDGSVGTDPFAGMGPSTSGGSTAPEGFTPIVMDLPSPAPPPELSSVGETPVTGGPRQLSDEELQRLQAVHDFILITTGGIVLGYATAGAGWSVLGQAAASGSYAGITTHLTSDGNSGDETTRATIQDFAIGFIPVPPPAQAAISFVLTKNREQHANDKKPSLSQLQRSFDPRYAW